MKGGCRIGFPESRFLLLERIASNLAFYCRGNFGAGKETFRVFKRSQGPRGDYSEGEVLHSWKQLQIEGIFELRVKFMKLFVNYVRDIVSRDENAVFLLNRFHLSTYVSTIIKHPELEREYDEILNVLRTLPVHVFILQLDENEIEERSLHPERSSAWQKSKQIADRILHDRLKKQQRLYRAAKRQQIPYSVLGCL